MLLGNLLLCPPLTEKVLIRTRLIESDKSRLVVEGVMLDRAGRRIKSVVWMDFTYISQLKRAPDQAPGNLDAALPPGGTAWGV